MCIRDSLILKEFPNDLKFQKICGGWKPLRDLQRLRANMRHNREKAAEAAEDLEEQDPAAEGRGGGTKPRLERSRSAAPQLRAAKPQAGATGPKAGSQTKQGTKPHPEFEELLKGKALLDEPDARTAAALLKTLFGEQAPRQKLAEDPADRLLFVAAWKGHQGGKSPSWRYQAIRVMAEIPDVKPEIRIRRPTEQAYATAVAAVSYTHLTLPTILRV